MSITVLNLTERSRNRLLWDVDKRLIELLNASLGTEDKNWKLHKELLMKVQEADYNEIKKILRNAQKVKNPAGYAVNAFKKMEI